MRYKLFLFILCCIVFNCPISPICLADDFYLNYNFDFERGSIENNLTGDHSDFLEKQGFVFPVGYGHDLLLIQPVIPKTDGMDENKLCLGYRGLLGDNSILLGVNSLFNFSEDYMHSCQGVGIEAFYQMLEFRASSRFVFSENQFCRQLEAIRNKSVEKYEAELGLPLPFLNWISIYGGAFWFDYENFSNSEGWKFRGEVRPFKYIVLNLSAFDDGNTEYRADGAVSLPFNIFTDNLFKNEIFNIGFSEEAYPYKIDHSLKMLDSFRINE